MDLDVCKAAADLLAPGVRRADGSAADGAAVELLQALGYSAGDETAGHHAALLRLAARFERLFRLPVPSAPGAIFLGAQVAPARFGMAPAPALSVGGIGTTLRQAFERCVGEAAERLSFLAWGDEGAVRAPVDRFHPAGSAVRAWVEARLGGAAEGEIEWLRLEPLAGGGEIWLPLDLCLRRAAAAPPAGGWLADSTGCAAGASERSALDGGLREVVERDAAALWWYGAMPPADLRLDPRQAERVAELLRVLDRPAPRLLDISREFGSVVVALSGDADGRGVALGFGSNPDRGDAACRAILELCQAELGHAILRHKLMQQGIAALAEPERRALRRLGAVDCRSWPQFTARRGGSPALPASGGSLPLVLQRHGYRPFRLRLTRPEIGIPAARAVVPGLQGASHSWTSRRLAEAVAAHGEVPAALRDRVPFV